MVLPQISEKHRFEDLFLYLKLNFNSVNEADEHLLNVVRMKLNSKEKIFKAFPLANY